MLTLIQKIKKSDLDPIVYGFLQKDFIYSIYKKNSILTKYKTNFKLSQNYHSLLKSINFLKELVTEPSNIIYPTHLLKEHSLKLNKKK